MVRLGLDLPPDVLALGGASRSDEDVHIEGFRRASSPARDSPSPRCRPHRTSRRQRRPAPSSRSIGVVCDIAICVIDGQTALPGLDESAHIAVREPYCLTNVNDEPLTIIEVQFGDYLGEDDIVRLEDDYGRG